MGALAETLVVAAAATTNDVGLPPRASLTTLITAESLLFAGFAVSANLAFPTDAGRPRFFAQGTFAYLMVVALTAVAVAAGFALYATLEPDPPRGCNEWVRTIGLIVGIGVQPVAAFFIARAAKNTKPAYRGDV